VDLRSADLRRASGCSEKIGLRLELRINEIAKIWAYKISTTIFHDTPQT